MHLQDIHDKQVLRLFGYNQAVYHELVALNCKTPPDVKTCSEVELTESLLMQLEELCITYDTQQRKMTEVRL